MNNTMQYPYINGVFRSQLKEITLPELNVSGEIPKTIHGQFLRNGPNPQFLFSRNYHMYEGDGMLHSLTINNGKASYFNRFIKTPKYYLEKKVGHAVFPGMRDTAMVTNKYADIPGFTANTHIVKQADKLLALNEGSPPFLINDIHQGSGHPCMLDGAVKMTFTAHPKMNPRTGDMHGYAYITIDGNIDYIVVDKQGKGQVKSSFKPPYQSLVHDFAITQRYVIFPIFPLTWDFNWLNNGEPFYRWQREKKACFCVLDKENGSQVRVFHDRNILGMHTVNAFEKRDQIILDFMLIDEISKDAEAFIDDSISYKNTLNRITMNLTTGQLHRKRLSDVNVEFPRIDERWSSASYRYAFMASGIDPKLPYFIYDSISCFDHHTSSMTTFYPNEKVLFGEPVFVATGKFEGDGYLLVYGYNELDDTSDLWILDARDIMAGAVAKIHIPQRVPYGFHGSWIPEATLDSY